jgi:hypothetical protein
MKKIFAIMSLALWAGAHSVSMNSSLAQTGNITRTIIPLTNQVPFTNTLVPPTNLTTIELSNVVTLLLTLQTNIEETLPVLDLIQSNAFVVSVGPTNGLRGIAPPLTNPASPILTPTGAASGSPRRQTSLVVKIGTNEFEIDAPTLLALFSLRQNLQQSLTALQALNGTEPTNSPPPATSLIPPPITNLPPTVTNFSPGPLTNTLSVPPTNKPPFVTPTSPVAF